MTDPEERKQKGYNLRYKVIASADFKEFQPISRSTDVHTASGSYNEVFTPARRVQRTPPPSTESNTRQEEANTSQATTTSNPITEDSTSETLIEDDLQTEDSSTEEQTTNEDQEIIRLLQAPTAIQQTQAAHQVTNQSINMALNVTLTQATGATRTPSVPKFVSPVIFDPSSSNPIKFIRSYERAAIANGWDDTYKINYLGTFLEGAANTWYNKYSLHPANANKTWKDIGEDFTREFGGENPLQKMKYRLSTRRQQAKEDIRAYFYDLQVLASEVDPNMDDGVFKEYFENGLHPSYFQMYYVMSGKNTTMQELKTIVHKLSELKERSQMNELTDQTTFLTLEEGPRWRQQTTERQHQPWWDRRVANGRYRYSRGFNNRGYGGRTTSYRMPNTRTNEGRPICWQCNRAGHLAAFCRSNTTQQPPRGAPSRGRARPYRGQRNPRREDRREGFQGKPERMSPTPNGGGRRE